MSLLATFTAPDGTDLITYTPDQGSAFVGFSAGTWEIQSGKAQTTPAMVGQANRRAVSNAGFADATFDARITFPADAFACGLYFNWKNSIPLGYWILEFHTLDGQAQLMMREPGQLPTGPFATAALPAQGSTHDYTIVTLGDSITIYQDGAPFMSYSVAGRINKAETFFGIVADGTTDPAKFDNVSVVLDDESSSSSASSSSTQQKPSRRGKKWRRDAIYTHG